MSYQMENIYMMKDSNIYTFHAQNNLAKTITKPLLLLLRSNTKLLIY